MYRTTYIIVMIEFSVCMKYYSLHSFFVSLMYTLRAGTVNSAGKSLFVYKSEESWDTFSNPSYQPNFRNTEPESQAMEICDKHEFCLFDIAATGIVDITTATYEGSTIIEEIHSFSIPGNHFIL